MVDGSNESLYRPDEESDPIWRKGIPLQKSFQKVDVLQGSTCAWLPAPSLILPIVSLPAQDFESIPLAL